MEEEYKHGGELNLPSTIVIEGTCMVWMSTVNDDLCLKFYVFAHIWHNESVRGMAEAMRNLDELAGQSPTTAKR